MTQTVSLPEPFSPSFAPQPAENELVPGTSLRIRASTGVPSDFEMVVALLSVTEAGIELRGLIHADVGHDPAADLLHARRWGLQVQDTSLSQLDWGAGRVLTTDLSALARARSVPADLLAISNLTLQWAARVAEFNLPIGEARPLCELLPASEEATVREQFRMTTGERHYYLTGARRPVVIEHMTYGQSDLSSLVSDCAGGHD